MPAASVIRLLLTLTLSLLCLHSQAAALQTDRLSYRCEPGQPEWQPVPAGGRIRLLEADFALGKVCQVRVTAGAGNDDRWLVFNSLVQSQLSSLPGPAGEPAAPIVWLTAQSAALALPPGGAATAQLRMIMPIGGGFRTSLEAPGSFLDHSQFNNQIRSELLTLLFAMGIVSALFALALRDRTTGWYTGFTLAVAVVWSFVTGLGAGSSALAVNYPWLTLHGLLLSYGLGLFLGLRFAMSFNNIASHSPRLSAVLQGVGWGILGYTALGFVPGLYGTILSYYNLLALFVFICMLLPGIASLRERDYRTGLLFLAGWAPIVLAWTAVLLSYIHLQPGYPSWLGQLALNLHAWGLLPDWLSSPHVRPGALLLQAVIYSLALADRAARLRYSREKAAMTDKATGLANRASFLLRGQQRLSNDPQRQRTLVLLDINRFTAINETLGYDCGDAVLRETGRRLRRKLGAGVLLARVGGNQFAALLNDCATESPLQMLVLDIARQSLVIEGQRLDIQLSCGAACAPRHGQDIDLLMRRAEIALNAARQERQSALVYHAGLERDQRFQLSLLSALRTAMSDNQLQLYLQPKADSRTGRVTGAEVLLRWQHPEHGLVSPRDFLPFAEKSGMIVELTRWMMVQAMQLARHWQLRGLDLKLSLNLSASDLADANLPAYVSEYLMHSRANPQQLILEITESEIMHDPQLAVRSMQALRKLGFQLALDDFGTGHATLAYLQDMPVSDLKIDRSFVVNASQNEKGLRLIESIVALAHTMGLRTVVEGVETEADWHRVVDAGCDEVQGYYLSPPLPIPAFEAWMALNQPFAIPQPQASLAL